MYTVRYDGSFDGFLNAVFDVYQYKFDAPNIVKEAAYNGTIFEKVHTVRNDRMHSKRVWTGLAKKLSPDAQRQVYQTFLSELPSIENVLLQYIQYAFGSTASIETDFGHAAVLTVHQTAKKVHRETHRMEAFVRFQQTADDIYFAVIEPDYNVLPLLAKHFKERYADQQWIIWDGKRHYGIAYDLNHVSTVQFSFETGTNNGKDIRAVHHQNEAAYQQLWQCYFKSVTIPARKNTRLHLQHMPMRHWKYLPEKQAGL